MGLYSSVGTVRGDASKSNDNRNNYKSLEISLSEWINIVLSEGVKKKLMAASLLAVRP